MRKTVDEIYSDSVEEYLEKKYGMANKVPEYTGDKEYTHAWYKHTGKQTDEVRDIVTIIDSVFI